MKTSMQHWHWIARCRKAEQENPLFSVMVPFALSTVRLYSSCFVLEPFRVLLTVSAWAWQSGEFLSALWPRKLIVYCLTVLRYLKLKLVGISAWVSNKFPAGTNTALRRLQTFNLGNTMRIVFTILLDCHSEAVPRLESSFRDCS